MIRKRVIILILFFVLIFVFYPLPLPRETEFKALDGRGRQRFVQALKTSGIKNIKILKIEHNNIFYSIVIKADKNFFGKDFTSRSNQLIMHLKQAFAEPTPFNVWLVHGKKWFLAGSVVYDSVTSHTALRQF